MLFILWLCILLIFIILDNYLVACTKFIVFNDLNRSYITFDSLFALNKLTHKIFVLLDV